MLNIFNFVLTDLTTITFNQIFFLPTSRIQNNFKFHGWPENLASCTTIFHLPLFSSSYTSLSCPLHFSLSIRPHILLVVWSRPPPPPVPPPIPFPFLLVLPNQHRYVFMSLPMHNRFKTFFLLRTLRLIDWISLGANAVKIIWNA